MVTDPSRGQQKSRFEPLSEGMKAAFREPLLNKITEFTTEPSCRHLLGQTTSTVDFADAMRSGKLVLVNLAKGRLGEHAHTLANLIFAKLQFEVLGRVVLPPADRRLFTIFCDEVQNIAENDLTTILAEGRKFGVSLISAHQYWEQLPLPMRAALAAAGTHIFFRLSAADASQLAPELSVAGSKRYVEELTSLVRGEAIARVGHAMPARVKVPSAGVTAVRDRVQLQVEQARRHAPRREDVEREILKRHALAESGRSVIQNTHALSEGQTTWN